MKPYNERLKLIDEAIEYHNGKWPQDKSPYNEECLVLLDNGNYITTLGIPGKDGYLCNKIQFEKRAKELGWINGQKEQEMNNDWYEKDELPPVGTECEYIIGEHRGQYKPCTFVGLNSRSSIVIETNDGEYLSYHNYQIKFRPLCTETDKLVDEIATVMNEANPSEYFFSVTDAASALVAKGYRKTKPMSEQEFMKQCVDICGYGDVRLYRAGCRFIDKGE